MKYDSDSSVIPAFRVLLLSSILLSSGDTCDVMGSRACGQKPEKEDRAADAVKYCIASRVYFECVYKKYRGCENKEKYEVAMESMLKGTDHSSSFID